MKSKIILLDSIRSMQNVGAIFRNSDGAGFEKVILTGHCPTPPRNDISKTALGAQDWIDWEYYSDPFEVVEKLKKDGYKIYSVELDKRSIEYTELFKKDNDKMNSEGRKGGLGQKVCLIMGNEISGVNQKLLDLSDEIVIIPMRGKKESLNVSVAAGIVMYAI